MQHNIEHQRQGENNNQYAYDLYAVADVANFIPSTVSLNVVKAPLTYSLDKQECTSVRTTFHNEKALQTARIELEDDVA